MTRRLTVLSALILTLLCSTGQADMTRFLSDPPGYDERIPTPESVIGFEVGDWHIRHDALVHYMEAVATASDRVLIDDIGRTHENRRQVTLTVSSAENIARIDDILAHHQRQLNSDTVDPDAPLVVWLGYSIHGNEASGSNASMLTAYHLAAMQGDEAESWLDNTVVLIDPSLNPDGLGRFAQWVNSHRGIQALVSDRDNREHNEVWPGGRFNHFWFDLNRDWLPLVHPESRNRVAVMNRWRPHVVADYHEMGTDSTYFFQPGVRSRQNPWTPTENFDITAELATYHARALDSVNQPYFTEEQFDDFYYGKGSTYPDALGAIGILFEQASARGHLADSSNGLLSFQTAIRNQFLTSLSTIEGAIANHQKLLTYRRDFRLQTADLASRDRIKAVLFGRVNDPVKARQLADMLRGHQIEVHHLSEALTREGVRYEPGTAYIVSMQQPAYRLLKSLFETRTEFEDNTFYDVSAWNMAMAYDLDSISLSKTSDLMGERVNDNRNSPAQAVSGSTAYAFDWSHVHAPRALNRLLKAEIPVRVATKPFTAQTPTGQRKFIPGAIMIMPATPAQQQAVETLLATLANEDQLPVVPIRSYLTPEGPDLGGPSMPSLSAVTPLIIIGDGVSPLDVGEVWHLLDQRLELPLSMVEMARLESIDLDQYSHVLMVNGRYDAMNEARRDALKSWVQAGGTLITTSTASEWLQTSKTFFPDRPDDASDSDESEAIERRPYSDFSQDLSDTIIGGAIVKADVDQSHPLAWGLASDSLPLFKRGTVILEMTDNPYDTPMNYADEPLLSGFLGDQRRQQMAGQPAVIASRLGSGSLIRFADNPNFRGFWTGTQRLYINALYFGPIIQRTRLPEIGSLDAH